MAVIFVIFKKHKNEHNKKQKRPNLYLCPFYCNVKPTKPQPQQAIEIDDDGAFSDQTNEEEYREFSAEKKDKEKVFLFCSLFMIVYFDTHVCFGFLKKIETKSSKRCK